MPEVRLEANAEGSLRVWLDGQELAACRSIELRQSAGQPAQLQVEIAPPQSVVFSLPAEVHVRVKLEDGQWLQESCGAQNLYQVLPWPLSISERQFLAKPVEDAVQEWRDASQVRIGARLYSKDWAVRLIAAGDCLMHLLRSYSPAEYRCRICGRDMSVGPHSHELTQP